MPNAPITYNLSLLENSRRKWERCAALREVYADLFACMIEAAAAGPILDVGSGIGAIRDFYPEVVTSDLAPTRWAQLVVSAYDLPSTRRMWRNVFALDVLHHLTEPLRFLASAAQVLEPGGRLVLLEPTGNAWGRLFYASFHHENIRPEAIRPPFQFEPDSPSGEFSNMAMATVLFGPCWPEVEPQLRQWGLRLHSRLYRDCLAYPLTGGFSRDPYLSPGPLRWLRRWEKRLPQGVLRHTGLRVRLVLEKT